MYAVIEYQVDYDTGVLNKLWNGNSLIYDIKTSQQSNISTL
jgi:hypothetical protein